MRNLRALPFLLILLGAFLFGHPVLAQDATSTGEVVENSLVPNLTVDIPGLSFSKVIEKDGVLHINFLGEYVAAVYLYLLQIGIVIAIVLVMIGGLQWALSAGGGDLKSAKNRIRNAVTGLVLLMSVYMILFIVNPALVGLKPVELEIIDLVEMVKNSGDAPGGITTSRLTELGIACDGSQGVEEMTDTLEGKVTYRFGAKGGDPVYEFEKKTSPSGEAYSDFCPDGTVCLDCSGYVGLVAHCAGLTLSGATGGSAGLLASAPVIESCAGDDGITLEDGTITTLTPGDIVGFRSGDWSVEPGMGHVWIYKGGGMLSNAAGHTREPGRSAFSETLSRVCTKFPLRFIDAS